MFFAEALDYLAARGFDASVKRVRHAKLGAGTVTSVGSDDDPWVIAFDDSKKPVRYTTEALLVEAERGAIRRIEE
jgi:hypothetical protein